MKNDFIDSLHFDTSKQQNDISKNNMAKTINAKKTTKKYKIKLSKSDSSKQENTIGEEQPKLINQLFSLLDAYQENNSFENREFLCYLTAAIFLTYRKLYPQLSIYLLFRTKGDISYIKNIQKEFAKYIENIDSKEPFDTQSITKDISGIRIVLDHINYAVTSTQESTELFNDAQIKSLQKSVEENIRFANSVEEYIGTTIHNGKQYFSFMRDLLERIISVTPEGFTDERAPSYSFNELYTHAKHKYDAYLNTDSFPTIISEVQINDLKSFLTTFRTRIEDQLHFALLRKTLPKVLEDPLVVNALKTKAEYDKEALKSNGFQSIYYTLTTPFGFIELQAQSNKAYYTATKGSAYHSGLKGKAIDVKDYFELVDPNDEHTLEYYTDFLDSISADSLVSDYELPNSENKPLEPYFFNTPEGIAYLTSERYREMMTHVKIKDKIAILPQYLPEEVYIPDDDNPNIDIDTDKETEKKTDKEVEKETETEIEKVNEKEKRKPKSKKIDIKKLNELIENGTIKLHYVDTDGYLLSTALSLSPYMNVCSSGHTSFTTVSIHHKKIIGEFSESLRKRDSNTCLRDLLIRRLEEILEQPSNSNKSIYFSLQKVQEHEEMTARLPKDISRKNIIYYAQKLEHKLNSDIDR